MWFFFIMTMNYGSEPLYDYVPVPTQEICESMLKHMQIHVSPGDESENVVVAFCAPAKPVKDLYGSRGTKENE